MDGKTRYSDEELEEFRAIIQEKLEVTKRDYKKVMDELSKGNENGVDDTSPTFHALEEGCEAQSKTQMIQFAARAQKFIQGLQAALVRIDNKTYGICRETGKLIPKERLRAVPHASMSIEAKQNRR